jgi:hypothetical protein
MRPCPHVVSLPNHDPGAALMQVLFIHRCDILREGERHASGSNVHHVHAKALTMA